MSITVGLRDQRLRLYARSDSGTEGFVRAVFTFVAEWWGRLDESHVAVTIAQQRLQVKLDAVAVFSDEPTIPVNGVLKDTLTGQSWWIRGFNSSRQLRTTTVALERVTDDQFVTFRFTEGTTSAMDGTHLVDA